MLLRTSAAPCRMHEIKIIYVFILLPDCFRNAGRTHILYNDEQPKEDDEDGVIDRTEEGLEELVEVVHSVFLRHRTQRAFLAIVIELLWRISGADIQCSTGLGFRICMRVSTGCSLTVFLYPNMTITTMVTQYDGYYHDHGE